MKIINFASIYNAISDELPDLNVLIEELSGSRVRRIDRFIQLCLAGSLSCCKNIELKSDCGLVIATGSGTVSTMAAVMETVWKKHHPPKPLHFINSLGNSACFYVARSLGITNHSTAVTQGNFSFEAALNQADVLLAGGFASQVLIGGVDEVPLPVEDHRKRLNADSTYSSILEGSHWILVEASHAGEKQPGSNHHINSIEYYDIGDNGDREAMRRVIEKYSNARIYLNFVADANWKSLAGETHVDFHTPAVDCYPHKNYGGLSLCHAVASLEKNEIPSALIISRSPCTHRFCVTEIDYSTSDLTN